MCQRQIFLRSSLVLGVFLPIVLLAQNEVELIDSPQTRIGTPATNYLVNDKEIKELSNTDEKITPSNKVVHYN